MASDAVTSPACAAQGVPRPRAETPTTRLTPWLLKAAHAVRSLHDLNALAGVCGKEGGIACDHADRLVALEQVVQHLMADQASGSSDDDHDNHLQVGLTDVACFCSMYDFLSTSFLV